MEETLKISRPHLRLDPHGIRRSAVRETLIFLSVVVALNAAFGDGTRFIDNVLHPFWIIVLMVTLQYGAGEALMAALLSSAFLLVGNMPEQKLTETMYDYLMRAGFLPFLWIVTALVLGSVRTRQLQERKTLMDDLKYSQEATATLGKGYLEMKQAKEQLELRLAEERHSVISMYHTAKQLEPSSIADVHTAAETLVRSAFSPKKFSLFTQQGSALHLHAAQGWETTDGYIAKFAANSLLAKHVIAKKRILSIVNEGDEAILKGEGVLAGPIYDEATGRIFGMLKIEDMDFIHLGLHAHETFRAVCQWIGHLHATAEKHAQAAAPSTYKSGGLRQLLPRFAGQDAVAAGAA